MAEIDLVPGRECGTCNACCVVPSIDDPELRKLPGVPCVNTRPDGGCAIYETRPRTCRDFFCGWRRAAWIGEDLRPDRSGVYIRLTNDPKLTGTSSLRALIITVLRAEALDAPGLTAAIATAMKAGMPGYVVVPGKPGFTSCRMALPDEFNALASAGNHASMRDRLTALYRDGLNSLDKTKPSTLAGARSERQVVQRSDPA